MAARTALITGGEGDLALALRACLEAAGWQVIAPGRSVLDVTSTESVSAFFSGVSRLDLLVNNAGVVNDKPVALMSASAWDEVIAVNLDGAFRCSRAAVKLMSRQRSGHIINIGSFAALNGTEGQANYAAAKAGLIAFTQSVAREYGARNVRCNCVLPGFLETKMTKAVLDRHRDLIIAGHSLGRLNTTTEAARFIAQLDGFENISGQVFQLDSRIGRHL
jgi:3-oxoacyl-[acyl-carrier protein] reductase